MLPEIKTLKSRMDIKYSNIDLDKNINESIDEGNRIQKLIEKLSEFHSQTDLADNYVA